jgi:hypothetical protein
MTSNSSATRVLSCGSYSSRHLSSVGDERAELRLVLGQVAIELRDGPGLQLTSGLVCGNEGPCHEDEREEFHGCATILALVPKRRKLR